MRFLTDYTVRSDGDWIDPERMAKIVKTVESSGFDGLGFTDHPAPSTAWLTGGGHETLDPFAALGFCAALTSTITLFTHLLVIPYRNPLLQASAIASVDLLAKGRTIFVVGVGYQEDEFAALGVDFAERNLLFEEGIDAIKTFLGGDDLQLTGRHFEARGQMLRPLPHQRPHPPFWLGGNSAITRDRIAQWGQGWSIHGKKSRAKTSRTPAFSSVEEVAEGVADVRRRAEGYGRNPDEITIQAASPIVQPDSTASREQQLDELGRLTEVGVSWVKVDMSQSGTSTERAIDNLTEFGNEIIAAAR